MYMYIFYIYIYIYIYVILFIYIYIFIYIHTYFLLLNGRGCSQPIVCLSRLQPRSPQKWRRRGETRPGDHDEDGLLVRRLRRMLWADLEGKCLCT